MRSWRTPRKRRSLRYWTAWTRLRGGSVHELGHGHRRAGGTQYDPEQRWQGVSLDRFKEGSSRPAIDVADRSPGPGRAWLRTELLAAMHRVIDEQLTGKQWLALTAELNGMPQDEIARQLDSNRNAVYKLTHDARANSGQGSKPRDLTRKAA